MFVTKSSHMYVANFSSSISFTDFLKPPGSLSKNNIISFLFQEFFLLTSFKIIMKRGQMVTDYDMFAYKTDNTSSTGHEWAIVTRQHGNSCKLPDVLSQIILSTFSVQDVMDQNDGRFMQKFGFSILLAEWGPLLAGHCWGPHLSFNPHLISRKFYKAD